MENWIVGVVREDYGIRSIEEGDKRERMRQWWWCWWVGITSKEEEEEDANYITIQKVGKEASLKN